MWGGILSAQFKPLKEGKKEKKENISSRDTGGTSSRKGTAAHKPGRGVSIGFQQDGSTDIPAAHDSRSKSTEAGPSGWPWEMVRVYAVPGGYRWRRGWRGRLEPCHGEACHPLTVCEQRNSSQNDASEYEYLLRTIWPIWCFSPLLTS